MVILGKTIGHYTLEKAFISLCKVIHMILQTEAEQKKQNYSLEYWRRKEL